MRKVAEIQRVPVLLDRGYAGLCEFCVWQGTTHTLDPSGRKDAEAQAREHLGNTHPEKVAYWDESQTSDWWENLTPAQNERLNALIDSEVRLLGRTYSGAVESCTKHIGEQNKKWVLG